MDTVTLPALPDGQTFEQFWANLQKISAMQDETAKGLKETVKGLKETVKGLEETKKIVMENSRQMGLLHNSFGELAEHLVAPNILNKFKELGFMVEKISRNIEIQNSDLSKIITEIDILLENGEVAIVVEVKSKLRDKHLGEFINKMEKLRKYADRKKDQRKYIGAIAAAIMDNEQRRKILDEGIYVIEQSGDTMKITAPEGFIPREWI